MKYNIFFLVFILIFGCQENIKEKESTKIIDVELQQNVLQTISLSKMASVDSVKVIEVDSFKVFGGVTRAFWVADKLLLHTNSPTTLSLLDNSCKVVNQIAPDHIINDFTSIDIYQNNIYILDRPELSIYVYNESLANIEKIKFPFYCQSFKVLNDSIIVLYTGNEKTEFNNGKLIFYKFKTHEVINDLLPISEVQRKYFNFLTSYHFGKFNDLTIFWDSSINTIFSVNGDSITPLLNLDYGSNGVPKNFYNTNQFDNSYDFVTQMRKKGYAFRHFIVLSNKNYSIIVFEKGGDFYTTLYNYNENTSKTFKNIDDDIIFNRGLNDIKLSFFVDLYDENSFISFVPFEFAEESLAESDSSNLTIVEAATRKQNILLFGTLK